MSHFEEPQKPTELKGDPELVKRFKQKQREYYQKGKLIIVFFLKMLSEKLCILGILILMKK